MLLTRLQGLISGIYDVSIAHDVYDFLVTDRGHLPAAARTGESDEELIVAQPTGEDDGEVGMSLYLDPELLKRLSLAELEMQAEVDKYVASYWLMREQLPGRFPSELLSVLFERTRIDPRLARGREGMYREASRYAEKFCRRLEQSLRGARGDSGGEVLAELRRFYRLTNARKLAHIERSA